MNKIDKRNLTDQTKYVIKEMNQRQSCTKKLSKYVTAFDYIDKALTVLSATSGGVLLGLL